jgi:DNA-binding NarL/FixJ family response regulator
MSRRKRAVALPWSFGPRTTWWKDDRGRIASHARAADRRPRALSRERGAGLAADPQFEVEHCASIAAALQLLASAPSTWFCWITIWAGKELRSFCRRRGRAGSTGRVLVVTAWVSGTEARRLLQQGVAGIFLKHAPLEELTAASAR